MDESYIAALITLWEELRAALGDRFETLAPELSNLIDAYLRADDKERAAQAEVAVEDWIAEHVPALDHSIRLQMNLAMDTPALSFDLEVPSDRDRVNWTSIRQSLTQAIDTGSPGAAATSTATSKGIEPAGDTDRAAAADDLPVPPADTGPLPVLGPPPAIATVTRYTDISCPRRVWVEAERISVVVQLTVEMPTRSATVAQLAVRPDAAVAIRLTALAFDALNALEQTAEILPDSDSPPVVFHLKPRVAGPTRLEFDFRQAGNPIGSAVVDIEVTPYAVAETSEVRGGFAMAMPQGLDAPDLLLYIQYDTSTATPLLRFTLEETAHGVVSLFEPVPLHSDPAAYAADLYRTLSELADDAGREADDADLQAEIADEVRRLGYRLWRQLIPRGLKERYLADRAAWQGKTLLVVSDEPHIPWELVWPQEGEERDEAPWSVSLRLLRWLRPDAVNRYYAGPATALPFQAVACVAPSNTRLQMLDRERTFVLGLLPARHGHDASPASAERRPVLRLLREGGYDWLHVVTHGDAPSTQNAAGAIVLEDDKLWPDDLIDPDVEGHIRATRPGFVLNLCHGGRQVWGLTQLGGWANTLVSAGAGLVVAPLWEVTDSQALVFAQAFYTHLLDGAPVAAAVHAARLAARNGDPTWLAYSVYAHPSARVQP